MKSETAFQLSSGAIFEEGKTQRFPWWAGSTDCFPLLSCELSPSCTAEYIPACPLGACQGKEAV